MSLIANFRKLIQANNLTTHLNFTPHASSTGCLQVQEGLKERLVQLAKQPTADVDSAVLAEIMDSLNACRTHVVVPPDQSPDTSETLIRPFFYRESAVFGSGASSTIRVGDVELITAINRIVDGCDGVNPHTVGRCTQLVASIVWATSAQPEHENIFSITHQAFVHCCLRARRSGGVPGSSLVALRLVFEGTLKLFMDCKGGLWVVGSKS